MLRVNTVNTTEPATTIIHEEKKTPSNGTDSDVGGVMSATMLRKKHTDNMTVISAGSALSKAFKKKHLRNVIFSHESEGRIKPATVIITDMMHLCCDRAIKQCKS